MTVRQVVDSVKHQGAEYRHGNDQPLGGYLGLMGTFLTLAATGGYVVKRKGRLGRSPSPGDLVLAAIATHKLSRLVTKETVTSPLRAPFTRFAGPAAPAELHEDTRGNGIQKAIGELMTCPFCFGHWVATGFIIGFALAPQATRMVASALTVISGADVLQFAYAAVQKTEE